MKIADISINRPVFAIMMSLALVTLGLFSYRTLGVDLMPKTDQPTVNVNVSLPGISAEEAETSLAKKVEETVNNVGGIDFNGDRRRQIQLLLDADRLTAYGLTADQVRNAIERQNIEIPGGNFIAGPSEIALRTMGRLTNVSDFTRIIISQQNGLVIKLGDIGRVVDTVQEVRQIARVDGVQAISLDIRKQSGSNTVAVADAVMAKLDSIRPTLPADLKIVTRKDQSIFIRRSIDDIQHHLILGSILASLVVFIFLW